VTVLAFGNDYLERPAAPVDLRSMLAIFIPSIAKTSGIFHGFLSGSTPPMDGIRS
jgi:hypothetical protein